MTSDIASQTFAEHKHLISSIDELIEALKRLRSDVQWGDSQWMQDIEILDFIRIQTLSLQNAEKNTIEGYYRDAYHLIRMVFEAYFVLRLISTCEKYPFRIEIKRTRGDSSLEDAKNRTVEKAKKHFGSRLITTYMEDKNTLLCVLRGIRVVDDKGNDTGVVVPFYYHAWHDFRPVEYHLKRETLQDKLPTLRFLTGEWASATKKVKGELTKNYGALYKYFLTFDKILENLRLNGVLNQKTTTRVLVHYNFLSNFTHSTSDSISIVRERKFHQLSPRGLDILYDHYLSELALLYVCHLLSMHLEQAIRYLKWRGIKLKNEIRLYRSLCKKANDDFGYFWFIFNKPHQYDIYSHANHKCNYRKRLFYRPEDVRLGDVRYYDNPLYRLKQLHQSQRELTTGNVFDNPFPRKDASF